METIYRGATYTATINSAVLLTEAALFNHATKKSIAATLEAQSSGNGQRIYTLKLSASDTKAAQVGVYDLELYSGSATEQSYKMEKHISNYATVIDTSKANS